MRRSIGQNDGGFIMVWALLLMVVLLILGVSGIGTSIFESQMTANDALHKQSFFQADGGANVAGMLIEENISCPGGFSAALIPPASATINVVGVLNFYQNALPVLTPPVSNSTRDAYYFYSAADATGVSATLQRTNIKTYGAPASVNPGGAMEMAAGYEGRGKGLPGGGGALVKYDTFAQFLNFRKSQSIVEIMWQHVIGFEGTCNY